MEELVQEERLANFVAGVRASTFALVDDDRLPAEQQQLLRAVLHRFFDLTDPNDWAQPLGLLYATYRGFGAETTRKAHLIGAFCVCYLASFDLFDDIQDDDLAGKPLADAGVPIAINSALALLLMGLRALHQGAQLEVDPAERARYLDVFARASLVAVGAQHLDLAGLGSDPTPETVLAMNRGKTSSVALLAECGAVLGGATATEARAFHDFGSDFAALVQIVDDVRDLFGKDESPDLAAGKVTYPIACFSELASAEEKAEFDRLRAGLPTSQDAIRELLCASGAVDASASAVEDLRQSLHERLMDQGAARAEHRLLLTMVDTLASTLYEPEPVPASLALFAPTGGFHDDLRARAQDLVRRLAEGTGLALPELRPWHAPLYLFEPASRTIRYPDLDGLGHEITAQFVDLLGIQLPATEQAMKAGMPLLLAHELFHAWRHTVGRLSEDAWHEEFVANRLAMGYALRFEPRAAEATLAMSRLILDHVPADAGEDAILARASTQGEAADYALSFRGAARIHARMLVHAAQSCDFEADCEKWLVAEAFAVDRDASDPIAAQ